MSTRDAGSMLIVIPAFGPAEHLDRAIASTRTVTPAPRVVVVDDGSEPPHEPAGVQVVRTAHVGVCHARNVGVQSASGDLLVFLDADDELIDGWDEIFRTALASGDVGCVCAAAELVSASGSVSVRAPSAMGPAFHGQTGLFLPGTFAVPRVVFDAVGGYDEGLAYAENTELALRITSWCAESGRRIVTTPAPTVRMYRRPASTRRREYATARLDAVERLFDVHCGRLALDRRLAADYARVAGASAGHLGEYHRARRWFARSLRWRVDAPTALRLLATIVPVLRRRVWGVGRG